MKRKKKLEFIFEFRQFLQIVLPEYIILVKEKFDLPKDKKRFPVHYKHCMYARKILRKLKLYGE